MKKNIFYISLNVSFHFIHHCLIIIIEEPSSTQNQSNDDLTMPPKQTFGKGKRARIPNKRYSDISLSNIRDSLRRHTTENGEPSTSDLGSSPVLRHRGDNASTPEVPAKKSKGNVDLSNPKYLKPFKYGWKRELIFKGASDGPKRNGDVFYVTPTGKRVKSLKEVSDNLKNKELSLDNFTFFKEPIGIDDPDKEIIRDTKAANQKKNAAAPRTPRSAKPLSPEAAPMSSSPDVETSKAKTGGFKVCFISFYVLPHFSFKFIVLFSVYNSFKYCVYLI